MDTIIPEGVVKSSMSFEGACLDCDDDGASEGELLVSGDLFGLICISIGSSLLASEHRPGLEGPIS